MTDKLPDGKVKIQPWHLPAVFLVPTFAGPLIGRALTSQTATLPYSEFSRGIEQAAPVCAVKN